MGLRTHVKRFQFDLERFTGAKRALLFKRLVDRQMLPSLPTPQVPIPKAERFTSLEGPGITEGDLVYIVEGDYKGKISKVLLYSKETDCVLLSEATQKVVIPKNYWTENQTSHVWDYPVPIPRKQVRLAAKERDENGNVSYVVAEELVMKERYYDANHRKWLQRRFVKHHESIEIPWPAPLINPIEDQYSTSTEHVYTKTHELQTVAKPPFARALLSELRNPFSRFKKRALTEAQARRLNGPQMPLSVEQKIYLAKKAKTPVKKLEPLSEEAKELIGSRIAERIAKIENPFLFQHLDAVSAQTTPEFKRIMGEIEKQKLEEQKENTGKSAQTSP